jgi:hypothetical protein
VASGQRQAFHEKAAKQQYLTPQEEQALVDDVLQLVAGKSHFQWSTCDIPAVCHVLDSALKRTNILIWESRVTRGQSIIVPALLRNDHVVP